MSRTARIDFGGVLREASLAYVPEAIVGDYVIVHAGFALSLVDEAEAQKVFEYLREIQELNGVETVGPSNQPPAAGGERL